MGATAMADHGARWDDQTDAHELRLILDGRVAATIERWTSGPDDPDPMWMAYGPQEPDCDRLQLGVHGTVMDAARAVTLHHGVPTVPLPAALLDEWGLQVSSLADEPRAITLHDKPRNTAAKLLAAASQASSAVVDMVEAARDERPDLILQHAEPETFNLLADAARLFLEAAGVPEQHAQIYAALVKWIEDEGVGLSDVG